MRYLTLQWRPRLILSLLAATAAQFLTNLLRELPPFLQTKGVRSRLGRVGSEPDFEERLADEPARNDQKSPFGQSY
jgi:hypothetical protein